MDSPLLQPPSSHRYSLSQISSRYNNKRATPTQSVEVPFLPRFPVVVHECLCQKRKSCLSINFAPCQRRHPISVRMQPQPQTSSRSSRVSFQFLVPRPVVSIRAETWNLRYPGGSSLQKLSVMPWRFGHRDPDY